METGQDRYNQRVEVNFSAPGGAAPASELRRRHGSVRTILAALPSALATLRKAMFDMTAVVLPFVAVIYFVSILMDETITIEAPSVPAALQERGLTPEFLTQRLQARIQEIQDVAATSKTPEQASAAQEPLVIEAAGLHVSLNSLAHMVQRLLGIENRRRLTVSVVCKTADCGDEALSLHIVALSQHAVVAESAPLRAANLHPAVDAASKHLLRNFDPLTLATYHFRKRDLESARLIVDQMLSERHESDVWLHNLRGLVEMRAGNFSLAETSFTMALEIDGQFVPTLVNWGNLYVRRAEAVKSPPEASGTELDKKDEHIAIGFEYDHLSSAIEYFDRALGIDPGHEAARKNRENVGLWVCPLGQTESSESDQLPTTGKPNFSIPDKKIDFNRAPAAQEFCTELANKKPPEPDFWTNLAGYF